MEYKYILMINNSFLGEFNPKKGEVGFIIYNSKEVAQQKAKQLAIILNQNVGYLEIPENKLIEILGQGSLQDKDYFKDSSLEDIHLPGEGKTLYNIAENYKYDGEGEQ